MIIPFLRWKLVLQGQHDILVSCVRLYFVLFKWAFIDIRSHLKRFPSCHFSLGFTDDPPRRQSQLSLRSVMSEQLGRGGFHLNKKLQTLLERTMLCQVQQLLYVGCLSCHHSKNCVRHYNSRSRLKNLCAWLFFKKKDKNRILDRWEINFVEY